MTSLCNSKLSVVIPTCNRAAFLDYSLEAHIPVFKKHAIKIIIFDNASIDDTQGVVEKWSKKYPFIQYRRHVSNVGADANFECALKAADTDYVWLLGDTYLINEPSLEHVLSLLEFGYDHILLNVGGEVKELEAQVYEDQNKLLNDLCWLMTCMSIHIYNKKLIACGDFERYKNSYFIQSGVVFDYVNGKKFQVSWSPQYSVDRISIVNGIKKVNWDARYFEIWVEARTNFIMSLPPSYNFNTKMSCVKSVSANGGVLGVKSALAFRANEILDFSTVMKYRVALGLVCSKFNYCVFFMCAFIPVIFLSGARVVFNFIKRR